MQITNLFNEFNKLQNIHGDKGLDSIYGCGKIDNPDFCLVFMNPTSRNISSNKEWRGLKAPWLGTKNIWKMLYHLNMVSKELENRIVSKSPSEWDYKFAEEVYREVAGNSIYITNLSKATQLDARHLMDNVFEEYRELFEKELGILNPKIVITFGNQVSSIILNKNIKVSDYRKRYETLKIDGKEFKIFPVYYPVGQGMRNMGLAKEDIHWIMSMTGSKSPILSSI
jgi:uracil-DNA glycosylase